MQHISCLCILLLGALICQTTAFVPQRQSSAFPLRQNHVYTKPTVTPLPTGAVHDSSSLITLSVSSSNSTPLQEMRKQKRAMLKRKKMINTSYLFILWYVFSVLYNIFSKAALNLAPDLAWTTATMQMSMGLLYVIPLWLTGLRKKPDISPKDTLRLLPVAILHSLVHIGGVVSMGAGAVSFTYIVKASEPAVSAVLAAFTGSILPLSVYATLIPVMGGVAIASVSELSFTWKSFNYAFLSNLASAGRGIVGKKTIGKRLGKNLSASNMYALLTILATMVIFPVALFMEGSVLKSAMSTLAAASQRGDYLLQTFAASLCYYLYNEVSFLALDNVSPISHALGNTLKRVFIIISSMAVFGNRMTTRGWIGSTLAVGGVFLYSIEKTRQGKLTKQKGK